MTPGCGNPQHSVFHAQSLRHRVPEDSSYGRMGIVRGVLFKGDHPAEMYTSGNGRPTLLPSLTSGAALP